MRKRSAYARTRTDLVRAIATANASKRGRPAEDRDALELRIHAGGCAIIASVRRTSNSRCNHRSSRKGHAQSLPAVKRANRGFGNEFVIAGWRTACKAQQINHERDVFR